jgi:hypothetical protein
MGLPQIKARIVAQLQAVSGIGKVYDRMRLITDEKTEGTDLVANSQFNAWFVMRESKQLTDMNVNQAMTEQKDLIVVRGFLGVKDSADSEKQMDALVDAVLVALNSDRRPPSKLGNLVVEADPPQLRLQDLREFGPRKVLCHHAEIVLAVQQAQLQ